jgi:hypothetical protein
VADLYRRALGREPSADETRAAQAFLATCRRTLAAQEKKPVEPDVDAWTSVCLAMFGCTEFRFVE